MTQLALERIPIFVLTGFLGSGKTTLLNALLKDAAFADSAVIVNEFGEIGLDHLLIASAKENTILLDAGCLCCAVVDSLKETLADLYQRRARADLPPFQRILIETTGLADPGPILRQLVSDPLVAHFYSLRGLICTVDAIFGEDQLSRNVEAAAQAAVADWLIVTKSDLAGGAWAPSLTRLLRSLNPSAEIHRGARGALDARALSGISPSTSNKLPWLDDIRQSPHQSTGPLPNDAARDAQDHSPGVHDHSIGSQSFWLDEPVTWSGIAAWTEWMRREFGASLLRCKGVLNVTGVKGPVVLHGVRDRFDITRLAAWPDAERRSRLVVIGHNLNPSDQLSSLGWLYAEAGTLPPVADEIAPRPSPPPIIGKSNAI